MESKNSNKISLDTTENLFYNNKTFEIPKIYLDNIDLLFSEKNLNNILNNENEIRKLEKFLPSNIVNNKIIL